jgi:hypothetical protein
MKMAVFWVVAPCRLVQVHRRFGGPYCFHHQGDDGPGCGGSHRSVDGGSTVETSETSVHLHQSTRRYNPADSRLTTH